MQIQQALEALFSEPGDWPSLRAVDWTEECLSLELFIPKSLDCFRGHFPDQPVLPGVLQVLWVLRIAERVYGERDFTGVRSVKYNGMLLPDKAVLLELRPAGDGLRFTISKTGSSERKIKATVGEVSFASSHNPAA
ncbi:MAG: hypothetical protein AAF662_04650 [Pseudomonadota bacterium]